MKLIVLTLTVLSFAQATKLPANFKKCSKSNPNLQNCVLEASQANIRQLTQDYPHINLHAIDPLEILELKISAGSTSVVSVDQNFKNCKVYGLSKLNLQSFDFNLNKKFIYGKGVLAELIKKCDYNVNGKILMLPITGNGVSTIKLKNIKFEIRFNYDEEIKNGKTYIRLKDHYLLLDPEFVEYNFENLFDGNKALGDNINKVLNENYKKVFDDVKKGYEDGIGLIFMKTLNNFFEKVCLNELFD